MRKSLVVLASATWLFAAVPVTAEQYVVDYGNGYGQNVDSDTHFPVGSTYLISTPVPTPAVIVTGPGEVIGGGYTERPVSIRQHIINAAGRYRVDASWMIRIAECESRLDPSIRSKNGLYHGMFQYDWPTWYELSAQAGYAGTSPYNAEAASYVTAYALSRGQAYRWPRCRYA